MLRTEYPCWISFVSPLCYQKSFQTKQSIIRSAQQILLPTLFIFSQETADSVIFKNKSYWSSTRVPHTHLYHSYKQSMSNRRSIFCDRIAIGDRHLVKRSQCDGDCKINDLFSDHNLLLMIWSNLNTVSPLIISAPPKCVIPKEKAMLCLFSFGITIFLGVDTN